MVPSSAGRRAVMAQVLPALLAQSGPPRRGRRNRPTRRVVVAYPALSERAATPCRRDEGFTGSATAGGAPIGTIAADAVTKRRSYIAPYTHGIPFEVVASGRDVLRGQSAPQLPLCSRICLVPQQMSSLLTPNLDLGLAVRKHGPQPPRPPTLMQKSSRFRAPFASAVQSRSRSQRRSDSP